MKLAPEVKLNKKLLLQLEEKLTDYVYQTVFKPLIDIIEEPDTELLNAEGKENIKLILQALKQGKISYDGTYFKPVKGKFGVRLAKEFQSIGAVLKNNGYKLPRKIGDPTLELIKTTAIAERQRIIEKAERMKVKLMEAKDLPDVECDKEVSELLENFMLNMQKSLFDDDDSKIGIKKQLSALEKQQIIQEYIENIQTYSKKLLYDSNKELRTIIVGELLKENLTVEALTNIIQGRYGIAERHAKFIARQESHMAREKITKNSAKSLGFNHYVWQTVGDYKVRPMGGTASYMGDNHKRLDGKIFSFDDPPIVDRIKGRKCNPGEDFGCRCTARVIIEDEYFEL